MRQLKSKLLKWRVAQCVGTGEVHAEVWEARVASGDSAAQNTQGSSLYVCHATNTGVVVISKAVLDTTCRRPQR
ncbi:hypothetical protein ACOMHN_043531 [Nucella lapillus]